MTKVKNKSDSNCDFFIDWPLKWKSEMHINKWCAFVPVPRGESEFSSRFLFASLILEVTFLLVGIAARKSGFQSACQSYAYIILESWAFGTGLCCGNQQWLERLFLVQDLQLLLWVGQDDSPLWWGQAQLQFWHIMYSYWLCHELELMSF